MSTSPLMSLGTRAMTASYASLQVTGHNIANANVAGFSRQKADLTTAGGQFKGSGFYGRGVDVQSVTRFHNEFLTREAAGARALASMDAVRLEQLQRLENVFKPGALGLGQATSDFMSAMVDLSSYPADLATRQVVLSRADEMATRFAEAGVALDDVQAGVTAELRAAVTEVNGLARSIVEVNQRIAAQRSTGQPPNDLLDERDRLMSRLSAHVQVTRIDSPSGDSSIFIGGGHRLLLGTDPVQLEVVQDDFDPRRSAIAIRDTGVLRRLDEGALGAGSIAGVLRFQNEDLVAGRTLVGRLAAAVGGAINEQQMRGLSLQTPLGSAPTSPLFAFGAPAALPHQANARDAGGVPLGSVNLTVRDPSALQASEYDLRETAVGSGSWVLTRLSDGVRQSVVSGDVVDGMQIDFSAPPPVSGDRFLLQPVTRAANGMVGLLSNPLDLAAASLLYASQAPGNVGTASVVDLRVQTVPLPTPGANARLTFTSDSGDYNWELFDTGGALLSSGTGTWTPGEAIPTPPVDINGFSLDLAGVPRTGDVINIEPTPVSALATSNGNALAMLALRDAAVVGGRTPTDAWSTAMADIGVRVQVGRSSSDISNAVSSQAELARSSVAGVNLDEEASRLIQFQQSYQAAAKMLQVAQSLFDTVLNSTSG
jgi:flagellar hook-associated protein 1 FlgK